jgi:hypothetical protein
MHFYLQIQRLKLIVLTFLLSGALVGCASYSTVAQKPLSLTEREAERARPQLSQPLMGAEGFSEQANQKVLSSRVELLKSLSLAIVRLDEGGGYMPFRPFDDAGVASLYKAVEALPKVKRVVPIPDTSIGAKVTYHSLRTAAVLMQADVILVLKSASITDTRYRVFEKNQAKAMVVLEAFAMDTRSGVMHFSGVYSDTAEVSEQKDDYGLYDARLRAQLAGEAKIFTKLTADLGQFLR